MTEKQQPSGELSLLTLAMPADTNPSGDIFGGWLMSQMDLAGANFAFPKAGGRIVTVAVDSMCFHLPVYVGDMVSCYCEVRKRGRTSITVHIETWVRRRQYGRIERVTEALYTFVAVDQKGRPRPLPETL